MSNFTKALKDLTGFGEDEKQNLDSVLPETDEELKFADNPAPVVTEAKAEAPKPEPVKAPTIPMDTIDAAGTQTYISKAMMIQGNIESEEDIVLEGYIAGDVKTSRNFRSVGVQVGKVEANRLAFNGSKHKGNVDVAEMATISTDAVVVGDIKCNSLKTDGRVKGNLDVETETLLLDNACVVGSVATGKINPAPGARISGNIVLRAVMTEIEEDFNFDIDFDFGGEN